MCTPVPLTLCCVSPLAFFSLKGEMKIVLSTNIAETSVTIDYITCVIDAGRAKEKVPCPHLLLSLSLLSPLTLHAYAHTPSEL
jgi:hypothetical protein